ncbi:hypothetical protein D9M71_605170 [compost metagenome]
MGDFRDGDVGDVPGAFLDGVEDRQQGTGGVLLALQHAVDQGQVKRLIRHTAFLCFTDGVDKRSSGGLGCGAPATSRRRGLAGGRACVPAGVCAHWSRAFGELAIPGVQRLHPSDASHPETDLRLRSGETALAPSL